MTDVMPQQALSPDLGFTEDQLHDAFYVTHRAAELLGRSNHGPRIVNTRWDLDDKRFGVAQVRNVVIRCVFVVKEQHYRARYTKSADRLTLFDVDRVRLETLVKDMLEARGVTYDTLYVGVAQGNL
jgi:hypothetical protein